MGYLRCITPNRTRQAIFAIAYIFAAALVAVATAAVASHGIVGEATVDTDSYKQDADNGEEMVVKFTSTRTGRESTVTIPAVDLQAIGQAEDSYTTEDLIAGMRAMNRHPAGTEYSRYAVLNGYKKNIKFWVLKAELNTILRRYIAWSAEEETRLRDVLAMYYPKLTVID